MKKTLYGLLLILLLFGSFLIGARYSRQDDGHNHGTQPAPRVLYYVDPMNPAHTSDKPGLAPCGMPMEPVYADNESAGNENSPLSRLPGTAKITPEKQQIIGIRVEKVEKNSQRHNLRTLGRVSADENRTYRLIAGSDGWVWHVHESTTGSLVKKDQLMATVYDYQFLNRQQQYLGALEFEDRRQKTGAYPIKDQLEATKLELYRLGAGDYQIQAITRTRKAASEIELRSPVTGIVLARNISPHQRLDMGAEIFKIADLSRMWVLADVFEGEARYIQPGTTARVSLPHQGEVFNAVVSDVPPPFDAATRTLKVRLEMDNLGYKLRPDMFVDVEFLITFPETINVASDAILDSGLRKTVFVDLGNGLFEPRIVETGWQFGDRIEIVKGLMAGERIAVSGNFLIDSESKMKLAAAGMHGKPGKGAASTQGRPETPMKPERPEIPERQEKLQKDVVCGMDVFTVKAIKAGLKSEFEGKTYYFCSEQCKAKFDEEHVIHKEKTAGGMPSHVHVKSNSN